MDGQLGLNGENSSVPCLLERFLELGTPDSLAEESNSENRIPLKVKTISFLKESNLD